MFLIGWVCTILEDECPAKVLRNFLALHIVTDIHSVLMAVGWGKGDLAWLPRPISILLPPFLIDLL